METKLFDWQVPPFESAPEKRQDWIESQIQDGEKWWESQEAASSEPFLKLLSAKGQEKLQSNTLKADIRKFVETISDIREIGTFGSGSDAFKDIGSNFNDVVKFVYRQSHFPRQARKALQFSVGLARGYLWPRYIRSEFGWGPGMVEFKELGPREVLPTQLPMSGDIQGSYVVTIVECMGIAEAHARFPRYQHELQPISRFKYTSNAQVRRHEFWDRWRWGEQKADWENQYCEIRHSFIRDLRINRTGVKLEMGEKDTSWYYEVPSLGALISWLDPLNGLPASANAREAQCRVYPGLRRIITNPGMTTPIYDGPDFDWHGIIPAVQYDVDDWPWLAVGYSLLQDVASAEKGSRSFLDLMFRVLKRKMKPPLGYDLDAGVPREDLKRFDWLDDEFRSIGMQGDPSKAFKSVLPDSIGVEDADFKMLEVLEKIKQKTLGLNDLSSLAQLKFSLSSETADKILETIGPVAKGIAGNIEVAHAKICHMLKFIIFQYFTTRQLMSIVGTNGVSTKILDFDPASIVPSHMEWETNREGDSQVSKLERARWAAKNLTLTSVPSALLDVTQMQERMMWLNFLQRGFPVSFSTAFRKLGVENWGDTPGATEFEKYKTEQVELLELKAKIQALAAFEMGGGGPPDGKGGGGKGKGGGRPPSGKEPPKLEKRGGNSGNLRMVLSQSK